MGSIPWFGRFPWGRKWQPTPIFLVGKFHEQREAWWATVHEVTRVGHHLATKQKQITPTKFLVFKIEPTNDKKKKIKIQV